LRNFETKVAVTVEELLRLIELNQVRQAASRSGRPQPQFSVFSVTV